ncbi:uncharacterized protein LOC134273173 [Saccostrea cucullata]|uniref:uncharacterized protein LOC134273173 n=1 Tax=Saccostrea cuccullata TaxID=36930 RepID=UPI002ED112C5
MIKNLRWQKVVEMGTDNLGYKREASEQDDSVEDLVNITKGLTLSKKKQEDKPTEDLIDLLDSLKLNVTNKRGGSKSNKNHRNSAEFQKRGPGQFTPLETGYWPPITSTKREPDYLYGNNVNPEYSWSAISKEYNYAPGMDSSCTIWNKAAQNYSLINHQNKTAQKIKELSNKYHNDPNRCQRAGQDLDEPDGMTDQDLEIDGCAPTMPLDRSKLEDIPIECPTLELINNVISQDKVMLSPSYIGLSSPSYRRTSPFYASSPSSGYSGSPPPFYSNEPSPSYTPSPYPALSPPTMTQINRSPQHLESVNLDFQDLEEIKKEDLVGTQRKTDNFSQKTTKRPSSADDESKPSPPKRTNVDAMYDKDLDEDNILHSLMIAGSPVELVEYVLNLLRVDGEDVLKKIINDQNNMQRTPLFLAVLEGRAEVVKLLLKYGADPNIQGKVIVRIDQYELRAPLHLAAEMGDEHLEVLDALIDCEETDLDIRSLSDRVTPLNLALMTHRSRRSPAYPRSCSKCIKALVEAGVDTDEMDDKSSKTPLMLVIDTMDLDLIKFFLCADTSTQHADVMSKLQAVTRGGDTPLHIAAGVKMKSSREKQKLLRILIRHGADANAKNNVNEVPKDIATNEVWKDIFKESFK